ncbi:hypothetical protein [Paenibacillus xylanivorans]|uniref:Uncharacterized protein n=1 Tax=Paenibacillus xylanivorans TaxID=1705561 RepID=A0A0M9BLR5_9BACL|nr:hypothetical protein [Paenibacillus xylanivorans]KOY14773.1 hypothetical protein AMS66_19765 [Paenibacillus xylanivorans]
MLKLFVKIFENEQGAYEIYESPWGHAGDEIVHTTLKDLLEWGDLTTGTVGGKDFVKRMSEVGPNIDLQYSRDVCKIK